MNDQICSLSNVIAYRGLIKHSSPEIQDSMLQFEPD